MKKCLLLAIVVFLLGFTPQPRLSMRHGRLSARRTCQITRTLLFTCTTQGQQTRLQTVACRSLWGLMLPIGGSLPRLGHRATLWFLVTRHTGRSQEARFPSCVCKSSPLWEQLATAGRLRRSDVGGQHEKVSDISACPAFSPDGICRLPVHLRGRSTEISLRCNLWRRRHL